MACSSLNSDLYRKNIVPSPSCACGGFESAYHFFFICPKYNATRERYLEALLRNHTTHDLLFGKDIATDEENEALFLKVQDYILKVSNRAKIRNRYNQVPHLTQDINGKVTNSQKTPQTRAKRSALSQQVTTKHI